MRSINVDVFTFDELSDEVKAKLVEENRYEFQGDAVYMDWKDMWSPTIEEFEKLFNVDLGINDRYGWSYRVSFNETYYFDNGEYYEDKADDYGCFSIRLADMSGEMLRKYIDNLFSECMKSKTFFGKNYGKRRRSRILKEWNNCPLTGCCSDISILEPIAEYLNHKKGDYGWKKSDGTININWKRYTFQDLMEACAESIIKDIKSSSDYYLSDEYILEELYNIHDGDEFLADGSVFK